MKIRAFLLLIALAAMTFAGTPGHAATTSGIVYVSVDDGTEIAVQMFYPPGFVDGSHNYPALMEIEGYGGAASPNDGSFVGNPNYVVVAVSLRGTGCSQGQLDLFSDRSSEDGAWIIDNWIPNQSWSNGDVGIYGHSYGGLTGFLVAAAAGRANSTHLRAAAVSGLIDDFYRGILYPGGVSNYGFPVLWGAFVRPESEHASNGSYVAGDSHCAQNYATHEGSDAAPTPQLVTATYGSPFATADSWAIQRALLSHIDDIKVPIQLGQQYQDEQTGPRGGHVLWQNLPTAWPGHPNEVLPKRITISTGRHNPNDPTGNKKDWLDCWVLHDGDLNAIATSGKNCAEVRDPSKRVLLYFESEGSNRLAPYTSSDWPLPETQWTRYYLRADNTLSTDRTGGDGQVMYASTGNSRFVTGDAGDPAGAHQGPFLAPYGWNNGLPDAAAFTLNFANDAAIAGPIDLTLYASISSANADFWAEILDRAPDGSTTFVQRGLLRASAAAQFEPTKSQYTPAGDLYRPYYDYTAITPVIPGTVNKYDVEIFPLGHYWRAGHQLVLQLHAPPANDPISTYAYEPTTPAVVTIVQDADHPTSILLPFMPTLPPHRDTAPACGAVVGEVCVTPALG